MLGEDGCHPCWAKMGVTHVGRRWVYTHVRLHPCCLNMGARRQLSVKQSCTHVFAPMWGEHGGEAVFQLKNGSHPCWAKMGVGAFRPFPIAKHTAPGLAPPSSANMGVKKRGRSGEWTRQRFATGLGYSDGLDYQWVENP